MQAALGGRVVDRAERAAVAARDGGDVDDDARARASRSRAVSTRSELRAISSGFSGSMLVTARNAGISRPSSSTTGKKCWWWIIVVASTSSGKLRNSGGKCRRPPTDTRPGPAPPAAATTAPRRRMLTRPPSLRACVELAANRSIALGTLQDDEVLGRRAGSPRRSSPSWPGRRGRWWPGSGGRRCCARAHVLHQRPCAGSVRRITNGTTRPPKSRTSQRIGRPNVRSPLPSSSYASQRICFGKGRLTEQPAEDVGEHIHRRPGRAGAPDGRDRRPWASRRARAPSTSTPCFFAKPLAATVRVPSAATAPTPGGPVTSSSRSVCRSGRRATRAASRRGVL